MVAASTKPVNVAVPVTDSVPPTATFPVKEGDSSTCEAAHVTSFPSDVRT